jgi:hypothetical protein
MELTAERREQLLKGYDSARSAAGEAPHWSDVTNAPRWVQDRILEIRVARADNKPVPPPSRDYVAAAEMRMQIAAFNERHKTPTVIPRTRPAAKKSSTVTLSSDEARKLAKEYGVSLQDVVVARSLEQTAGVPLEDTLNHIKLRAVTARVERAQKLEDEEDDDEWDSDRHAREANRHRTLARKSSLDIAVKHYSCGDAHQKAADDFTYENSRKARKASRLAFPESVIS